MLSTLKMYFKQNDKLQEPTDLYAEQQVKLLDGGTLDLETLRGHPTLFVNTASKCGFTPQFAGLQTLYQRYGEQGLAIVGTPSGDFAGQEFDDADEIGSFCQRNYGVTFPMTESMSVRADPAPLWAAIAEQPDSGPPSWNFTKYLVDKDGHLIERFSTTLAPEDPIIVGAIEKALAEGS
jgi:glutathione peroxidase